MFYDCIKCILNATTKLIIILFSCKMNRPIEAQNTSYCGFILLSVLSYFWSYRYFSPGHQRYLSASKPQSCTQAYFWAAVASCYIAPHLCNLVWWSVVFLFLLNWLFPIKHFISLLQWCWKREFKFNSVHSKNGRYMCCKTDWLFSLHLF